MMELGRDVRGRKGRTRLAATTLLCLLLLLLVTSGRADRLRHVDHCARLGGHCCVGQRTRLECGHSTGV